MILGVVLTTQDLEAIRELFEKRWMADIKNWKERDTDYCMWFVRCPDKRGSYITETGISLAETIDRVLRKALN